ncbi:ABC transporter [Alsobacter soli]|uniref:ABC transporter n=1 Tax=Alsobacter soli TaxID=2109933 RepID=A0A2T1HU62_9HYPH|nr:ABC-type transport auxiliary lipoprotein family protein [Alsobacter soli]PSC05196.1 ABC transporter [Alsobacter soli]
MPSRDCPSPARSRRAPLFAAALAVGAGCLGLAGCGSSTPSQVYDLTAPVGAARQTPGRTQLVVAEPTALQPLESDRIIVRANDGSVSNIGGVQWSDRLPRLLQTRLVEAFENHGRAVARTGVGVNPDTLLQTEIRFFGVRVDGGAQAVVELSVKTINNNSGKIVASRVFKGAVPLAEVSGKSAALALDQAATKVFADVVRWAH